MSGLMHAFKGIIRKTHVQSSMALPECMTFAEIFPTTIFSVKIMHDCIKGKNGDNNLRSLAFARERVPQI